MPCLYWSKNQMMLSLIATLLRKVDHFVASVLINLFPQEVQISTLSYSHLYFLNSYLEQIWHLQIAPFFWNKGIETLEKYKPFKDKVTWKSQVFPNQYLVLCVKFIYLREKAEQLNRSFYQIKQVAVILIFYILSLKKIANLGAEKKILLFMNHHQLLNSALTLSSCISSPQCDIIPWQISYHPCFCSTKIVLQPESISSWDWYYIALAMFRSISCFTWEQTSLCSWAASTSSLALVMMFAIERAPLIKSIIKRISTAIETLPIPQHFLRCNLERAILKMGRLSTAPMLCNHVSSFFKNPATALIFIIYPSLCNT